MSGSRDPEILNVDQAADLLGVSVKTFSKVLHQEALPARKIGREWKFSRAALIEWIGSGSSLDYYNGSQDTLVPAPRAGAEAAPADSEDEPQSKDERRTAGWKIEQLD
jgi:excisionase family DNA binding protein